MDYKNGIFKNTFLLSFKDDSITQEYNAIIIKQILKCNPWFVSATFLITLASLIFKVNNLKNVSNLYTAISVTSICFVNLILVLLIKRPKFQKFIVFVSYLLITFSLYEIREILIFLDNLQVRGIILELINLTEFFLRLMFFVNKMILFVEGLILNFLCIFSLIIYERFYSKRASLDKFSCKFTLLIIFLCLIAYIFKKEIKNNFYVNLQLEKKNKWHISIMNNMNSGFICIKDKKIDFVNNAMINKIKINRDINKIIEENQIVQNFKINDIKFMKNSGSKVENTNEEIYEIIKNDEKSCEKILDIIFRDMNYDINNEKSSLMKNVYNSKIEKHCEVIVHQKGSSESDSVKLSQKDEFSSFDFLKVFQNSYTNKNLNGNFTLLGYKDLLIESVTNGEIIVERINLEVNGRFYKISDGSHDEIYEFIFKDITRTKNIEEKNAEFKYKTLFLSKVAHEFKNPLICITELVNQIYEDIDVKELARVKKNLKCQENKQQNSKAVLNSLSIIKALSNYMLILVKDLDFFSQTQIGSKQVLQMNVTNLKEILDFCSDISIGLIKKNNKDSKVSMVINKGENLPKTILTDDTKLKQILVNLISNAIKFTENGKITINLYVVREGMIRFEIEDTGSGMSEEQKMNLFKPYYKLNSQNNKFGAGLGLTILSDLINKLGSKIFFDSKLGQGTKFWFDLTYNVPNEDIPEINLRIDDESPISMPKNEKSPSQNQLIIDQVELNSENGKVNEFLNNSAIKSIKSRNSLETVKQTMQLTHPWMKKEKTSTKINTNHHDKNNNNYYINNQIIIKNEYLKNTNSKDKEETFASKNYFEDLNDSIFNYVVADDEKYARKSVIRVLTNAANKIGKKINLIESEDGIETLYIIYQSISNGVHISGIISDENMKYMTGSRSAQLLKSFDNAAIKNIPFYLATAYDDLNAIEKASSVDFVYQKPFNLQSAEKFFSTQI